MTEGPVRTCVGCRRVRPKRLLVRLVRQASGLVVADRTGRATGRGAYVCLDPSCVERAIGRGRLSHAFRKPCEVGSDIIQIERSKEVRGLWQQER